MPSHSLPSPQPDAYLVGLEPEQRNRFLDLARILGKQTRTLPDYRTCGELLAALRPAEGRYGTAWLKSVCEALSRQEVTFSLTTAYRLIRFAEQYPGGKGEKQIRQLDGLLSWESMMRIIHVEDANTRDEILRVATSKKLRSRGVIALIREKSRYRRARGGRPKAKSSTHPHAALKELRAVATKWKAVHESWVAEGNNALLRAAKLKPTKITDAFLDDLKAATSLVEEMAITVGPLAQQLSELQTTLNRKRLKQK